MKILVTGAGGYVGTTLCGQLLQLGYDVRAVDNFHKGQCDALIPYCFTGGGENHFEFQYGDVSNPKHVEKMVDGVDGIIHLAGIVGFPACAKQPGLSHLVNVTGTSHICHVKPKEVPLFFASTGSVYGKVEGTCTEDSPTNPLSEYGLHKLAAEKIVRKTPNAVAYRFATAFGVSPCMRVNLLINDLVYQAYNNRSLVIFQADFRRTFVHVYDMGMAFAFGLQRFRQLKHNVYNVGSPDNNWTKRELAEKIKEKTGCLVTYAEVGKDLDQRDYEVDYSRFLDEGWRPNFTVEEGIDEMLKVTPLLQIRHQYE